MVFKTDEDMSLDKYWEKHCISIAKDRRWAIQKGDQYSFENCATLRQYDDYIKKVASYLDMSISEITPANILHAVSKVAKACQYQEATVKTIISSLRDVFSYAATCGHAYNILSKNRAGEKSNNLTTLMMQRILVPAVANAELSDNCPRALTIGQQGRLALYAAEHVLEDGRFCGILISLYTGMRPAECRGLRWNDFRSFPDHPDRHYLKIDEILNDKLEYSKQVKTKNALRCVPVHIEIEDALQKRREFVQQNMGANKDIGELPIACFGNQFKDPCRGSDYSNFSFKLLKEFGVSSEQLGFFLLDESDNLTPSDSHPPMRILRRNFATVIQACTDMSLEEKEYIFGHRISGKDGAKKRIEYSRNMDRLWRIAQKLDKAPFCKKLYELHFPQVIVGDGIVVQIYAHKHHLKPAHPWKGWREVWRTFKSAFWGLLMPVIILGGIYGGVFSATEAAAVAAVYGLFVGTVIYKKLKWKDIVELLYDTAKSTGGLMLIIGGATIFSYACTRYGISTSVQALLENCGKGGFLVIINIVLLIAGCFMDANSNMYIFVPIMYPVAREFGIDPIQFGMICTVNLAIGQFTPPVGTNLFVASSLRIPGHRVGVEGVAKACLPMIAAAVLVLLLVTYVPQVTTCLIGA